MAARPERESAAEVRVLKVSRESPRHSVDELTLRVEVHHRSSAEGDRPGGLARAVYAYARGQAIAPLEAFARGLAASLLEDRPSALGVRVEARQRGWSALSVGGRRQGQAFVQEGPEVRVAEVFFAERERVQLASGLDDLWVLHTQPLRRRAVRSTRAPLWATALCARWLYGSAEVAYQEAFLGVRACVLQQWSRTPAEAGEDALIQVGAAVLDRFPEVAEIRLSLPGQACRWVDLTAEGVDNPDVIYEPSEGATRVLEATVKR
jgi:urate oxidase